MKKLLLIATLLIGFLTSCNNEGTPSIPEPTIDPILLPFPELDSRTQEAIVKKGNVFANDLMTLMNQEVPDKNMMISPLSIQFVLGMASNGANEEALQEIIIAMGMNGYSLDMLNSYYYNLMQTIQQEDEDFILDLANAIWYQEDFEISQDFILKNQAIFHTKTENTDFTQASKVMKAFNQWASDATRGTIKNLRIGITDYTKMLIANACYMKGKWAVPFEKEKTKKENFYNQDGSIGKADMMYLAKAFKFDNSTNEAFTAIELPYGKENFSMLIILPKEGKTLNEIIPLIAWDNMQLNRQGIIRVGLPKFKIEATYSENLTNCIKGMGITRIFEEESNAFPRICNDIWIEQIAQATFMEVDETGTEAAAVTGTTYYASGIKDSERPTIRMDRPFAFAIRENTTGTVLFMGKVVKM